MVSRRTGGMDEDFGNRFVNRQRGQKDSLHQAIESMTVMSFSPILTSASSRCSMHVVFETKRAGSRVHNHRQLSSVAPPPQRIAHLFGHPCLPALIALGTPRRRAARPLTSSGIQSGLRPARSESVTNI